MGTPFPPSIRDQHPAIRYVIALLVTIPTIMIFVRPELGHLALMLLLAVLISAHMGGLGPGLLSTSLYTLLFLLVIYKSPDARELPKLVNFGLLTGLGVAISLSLEMMHASRALATASTREAEAHERSSRENEARLTAILSNSPSIVSMKDLTGRYTFLNREYGRVAPDATPFDATGKTDFDFFPAETAGRLRSNDLAVIRRGEPIEFEETIPQEEGAQVLLALKFPLRDVSGEVYAVCGIATDITERTRADAIREEFNAEASLRAEVGLALAGPGSGLDAMLAGCTSAIVRNLNGELARIWVYEETEGALTLAASSGLERSNSWNGWQARVGLDEAGVGRVASRRLPYLSDQAAGDEFLQGTQGTLWPARLNGFASYPLLFEDRLVGAVALFAAGKVEAPAFRSLGGVADLIALGIVRKRLETERDALLTREQEARAEAESANRAKDQFLAVLSHELRTPLTPVLATVTAMLDTPPTPEEVRPMLEMIQRSIELEARLIDDLLDVTRVVHGKLHLDRSTVDLHVLLHQTVGICRSDFQGKGMKMHLDLRAERHHAEVDPARLQQVFWNLVKNAVKFTPEGGSVTILTRNEAGLAGEDLLLVEVKDTGIGIDSSVLPRLFNAFEQGEASVSRRFGGLGLGLSISRYVAEAHGGRLSARSSGAGQGSTFTLELPAIEASSRGKARDEEGGRVVERRSIRILLVEDDAPSLKVMTRLLQQRQHEVTPAASIAQAIEAYGREEFDLVISDIGLTDGTGLELMRQLQQSRPVPGIALSGFGMDDDHRRSREAGFLVHLTKPVNFQSLEAAIHRVTKASEE